MTNIICRLFIKDFENTSSPKVRARYGTVVSIVGILVNLLLFAGKFIIGTLTASLSITADAVNNLSDAGSSIISFISFKISSKPADREHPFGHARIEYIASMIVSFLVIFIGLSLFSESVKKVFGEGGKTDPSIAAIVVLAISILGKLWLFLFNRSIGKKINSSVMKAAAADSISDVLSSSAVLAATLIYRFTSIELDAYMGIIVALFIVNSGIKIFKEALDSILGTAPDALLVEKIKEIIFSHPGILGIHDLIIHNYGPGRCFVSSHVEVDGAEDIYISHDTIDNIEKDLALKLDVQAVIHLDPIAIGDPLTEKLRHDVQNITSQIDERITIHDFRIVPGNTHTNIIFDAAIPFELNKSNEEISSLLEQKIRELDQSFFAVITIDRQ
ncbi:MAG: cation transporter [Clostridia bacterium]|nr:cation transporter [Clostridia bacterium]